MSTGVPAEQPEFGPWNPGVSSELPPALLPLSTILRPEHVVTTLAEAMELRDFTGLPLDELIAFRPRRLTVHELLIRVTADLSVPDGPRQEDLGINFRKMAETIFAKHLEPVMPAIERQYAGLKRRLTELIDAELTATLCAAAAPVEMPAQGLRAVFRFGRRKQAPAPEDIRWVQEQRILQRWANEGGNDPLMRAARLALVRIVSAIRIRHPRTRLDRALITSIATTLACNDYGSETLGRLIDPVVREAALAEGYRLLPPQERPVVMNTKGASASGKSTMRPLQKKLAGEIGVDWSDFALISPDIWRKYLLDYDTLGGAYKYAGSLTGLEMEVIHNKLDRYMAHKAERGKMSHLLIDRFRFDSFAPDSDEAGSNLLTRFGHLVYLFFMITPPHATVERAWKRGLEVGRYKAVDDLLAHNVEAFSGMPELFFTWALRRNKLVHYEFLDNSVPLGERPRTIAFGWNGELNIVDVECMLDIDRYCKIDVNARSPEAVYPDQDRMAAENNVAFLTQCARRLPAVNFVERATGRIYLRLESGRLAWTDAEAIARAAGDAETRAGIRAVAPTELARDRTAPRPAEYLIAGRFHTLGEWGSNGRH
ncbi:MAG: zeta toxin family protein [Betaproteobacteria bacterium]|nr:zeta toxin family protein [Betaproteobacteria bacterium]